MIAGIRYARIFWIGAAGVLVLAALIGVSSLLRSELTDTDWQILLTLSTLLVAGGTAVAGLAVVERGHRTIGWGAAAVAAAGFVVITTATWDSFDSDGLARLAGASAVALVATLLGTTQLVLHRGGLLWVVLVTWSALVLAATTTSIGIVQERSSDGLWKAAGSCWIVGLVGWLLLPVLQRFVAAAAPASHPRILATLDGVELVATRSPDATIDARLAPGERLALRRRG